MFIAVPRLVLVAALISALSLALTPPARADFSLGVRVAVGPKPANTSDPDPTCAGAKRLRFGTYAAQIVGALVVSNAVRHGAQSDTIFGSSRGFGTYLGEYAVEDLVADVATRTFSCLGQADVQGILAGSAIVNAANTEFPR